MNSKAKFEHRFRGKSARGRNRRVRILYGCIYFSVLSVQQHENRGKQPHLLNRTGGTAAVQPHLIMGTIFYAIRSAFNEVTGRTVRLSELSFGGGRFGCLPVISSTEIDEEIS